MPKRLTIVTWLLLNAVCAASISTNAHIPGREPSRPAQPIEESRSLTEILVDKGTLNYNGFAISRRHKRVKLAHDGWVDSTYAMIERQNRKIARFDAGIYSPLINTTEFGLFSFLGGKTKQLVISQDLPRTGTQWVVSLSPNFRIIFDGQAWGVGRESGDFGIIDLNHDGVYEITVPITDFYNLHDKMSMSEIPLPEIIFEYNHRRRNYVPANPFFQRDEEFGYQVSVTKDTIAERPIVLERLLTLVYAGKEKKAWEFYNRSYKLDDKQEIKRRIMTILHKEPVYKFIYKIGSR